MTHFSFNSNLNKSNKLEAYVDYFVTGASNGEIGDKLGEAFEEYCKDLFSSTKLLNCFKLNDFLTDEDEYNNFDLNIFRLFLNFYNINPNKITKIEATTDILHLPSGGNPKTDLLITIHTCSRKLEIPVSIKQTSCPKVSIAEFPVSKIIQEVGIYSCTLINLMLKHQKDGSAKNFTDDEKNSMRLELEPYKEKFLRWVFTGSKEKTNDIRNPSYLVKFNIGKFEEEGIIVKSVDMYTMDCYIKKTLKSKAGFETGLGWTYATGSKGESIQFKG